MGPAGELGWLTISHTHTHTHEDVSRQRHSGTKQPGAQVSGRLVANEDISYSLQPLMAVWFLRRSLALLWGNKMRKRGRTEWVTSTDTEKADTHQEQRKETFKAGSNVNPDVSLVLKRSSWRWLCLCAVHWFSDSIFRVIISTGRAWRTYTYNWKVRFQQKLDIIVY